MSISQTSTEAVADHLEWFVRDTGHIAPDDRDFTRDTDLFRLGYLDSLGVEALIAHIEDTYRLELTDEELSDPAFHTVRGIAGIVAAALRRVPDGR